MLIKSQLDFQPQYSSILTLIFFTMSLFALIIAWMLAAPLPMKISLSFLIAVNFSYSLIRYNLRSTPNGIRTIHYDESALLKWQLTLMNGQIIKTQLNKNSFVHQYLMILNFSRPNSWKSFSLVLLPDCQNKNLLKDLRLAILFSDGQSSLSSIVDRNVRGIQ